MTTKDLELWKRCIYTWILNTS